MEGLLLGIPALLFALTCHEVAHGYVAKRLGDPTASELGRLSLNPLKHISPFGTVIFPLMLRLSGAPFVIGWAKPVPVDPRYFRNPIRGMMWVGMAGPATNFILAAISGLLFRLLSSINLGLSMLLEFIFIFMLINLFLGFFNLIPIPPLDGSRIVAAILPKALAIQYIRLERLAMPLLMLVFLLSYLGLIDVNPLFNSIFRLAVRSVEFLTGFNLV